MKTITFQVIEGVDKGRVYRDLCVPVSIGREEGNGMRLNDERISRFHAKVQCDGDDVIITDLESTNGTRINGDPVQIRRLLPGDRVGVGRSVLVFGNTDEIKARVARLRTSNTRPALVAESITVPESAALTDPAAVLLDPHDAPLADKFWANVQHPPAAPKKLSAAQAARLTEILDFMHRGLASAADAIRVGTPGDTVTMQLADWLKIQAVQTLLAHYSRGIGEPGDDSEAT
jgi:predicted component of type VI protein secretion system